MDKYITKGLNVDLNPIFEVESNGKIEFCSGNSLEYRALGGVKRNFKFTYVNGHPNCFNDLLTEQFRFVPVTSGSQLCLQKPDGPKKFPEVHVDVEDIEKNELRVIDVFHEIGHAKDYLRLEDMLAKALTQGYDTIYSNPVFSQYSPKKSRSNIFPELNPNHRLTQRLIAAHYFFFDMLGEYNFDHLLESSAWNYAFAKRRELDVLGTVDDKAIGDHIALQLSSYGIKELDPDITLY